MRQQTFRFSCRCKATSLHSEAQRPSARPDAENRCGVNSLGKIGPPAETPTNTPLRLRRISACDQRNPFHPNSVRISQAGLLAPRSAFAHRNRRYPTAAKSKNLQPECPDKAPPPGTQSLILHIIPNLTQTFGVDRMYERKIPLPILSSALSLQGGKGDFRRLIALRKAQSIVLARKKGRGK